eukprot:jgi/Ulvmu1/12082/UM084_0005.1
MTSQPVAAARLVRALTSTSQGLAGVAFAADAAIAISDTLPDSLFHELLRLEVAGGQDTVTFVACACAYNAAVAQSGWDQRKAINCFITMWHKRIIPVIHGSEIHSRHAPEICKIIADSASGSCGAAESVTWAASECIRLLRQQLFGHSANSSCAHLQQSDKKPRGQAAEISPATVGSVAGAVLIALLSKASADAGSAGPSEASHLLTECLCLLRDAASSSSLHARSFACSSLLPTLLAAAAGSQDACNLVFTGVMEALEVLSDAAQPDVRRARFTMLLECTQHALHLKPLAALLLHAPHLEPLLHEGLSSDDTLERKRARQAVQDLVQLQRATAAPGGSTAALAAVDALLSMYDGLAMYELRLVRGTWTAHWPQLLKSCAEVGSARSNADSSATDHPGPGAQALQLGWSAGMVHPGYAVVLFERALRHENPAVQQFAAMAVADFVCNEDVTAAVQLAPMWVAGDLARLLMGVPGCNLVLERSNQMSSGHTCDALAEHTSEPWDPPTTIREPWDPRCLWERDCGGDASAAICQIFSSHASVLMEHPAAVQALCSHIRAPKLAQMPAALLCSMLASVVQHAHAAADASLIAAVPHVGGVVSATLLRHGAEGSGMAAGVVAATCATAGRRGNLLCVLRALAPELPQACFLPEEGGAVWRVMDTAVTATAGAAAAVVEELKSHFEGTTAATRQVAMDSAALWQRCQGTITAARMAALLPHGSTELEKELNRSVGMLPQSLEDMYRRPYLQPGFVQCTLLQLHAVLLACVTSQVKAVALSPSPCHASAASGDEAGQHDRHVLGMPLQRALVKQAAKYLPTLGMLGVVAVKRLTQVVTGGNNCLRRVPSTQSQSSLAHWSPPFNTAMKSFVTEDVWSDLHRAALLTFAAADTLQLVLAGADSEPSFSPGCIQDGVKACLDMACALAPLAFDARQEACAAWHEVKPWAAHAVSELLHAIAGFPVRVARHQAHARQPHPKIWIGGRRQGHVPTPRLAGLRIDSNMHAKVTLLQTTFMLGLETWAGSCKLAAGPCDPQQLDSAQSEQMPLPWGALDGALMVCGGFTQHAAAAQSVGWAVGQQVGKCPRQISHLRDPCIRCSLSAAVRGRRQRRMHHVSEQLAASRLQPLLVGAALAALPQAAERDAVHILRCLRGCIVGAVTSSTGAALLSDSWQALQQSGLAPLVATATTVTKSSSPLVLLMAAICQQSLLLMKRKRIRRPGVCAAMLNVCLARCWFDTSLPEEQSAVIAELHGKHGPLPRFVAELLALGAKSSALVNLTSIQLCSRLLLAPSLVPRYKTEVVTLLLFGGTPVSASVLAAKHTVVGSEITSVLDAWARAGGTPLPASQQSASLARTAVVHFCHSLARLAQPPTTLAGDRGSSVEAGGAVRAPVCAAARDAGDLLLRAVLAASEADPELMAVVPFKGSAVHRKKVRLWQALAVLAPFHTAAAGSLTLDGVLATLQQGEIASIKQYQEAVLLLLLEAGPEHCQEHLLPILRDYSRPKQDGLASIMLVCAIATSYFPEEGSSAASAAGGLCSRHAFVEDLVSAVLPHISTHHHQTRCFAHVILHGLLCAYPHLTADRGSGPHVGAAALRALQRFTETNPHAQRLLAACPLSFAVRVRDLCHPRHVLRGATVLIGGSEREPIECAPVPALDRIGAFLEQERSKVRESAGGTVGESAAAATAAAAAVHDPVQPPQAESEETTAVHAYQRKIEPWEHCSPAGMSDEDRLLRVLGCAVHSLAPADPEARDGEGPADSGATGRRHGDLIVVASLIDKATNLGGLARTCEIFAAKHLVVADASVAQDRDFTLLSMHAEERLSIRGVSPSSLPEWLQACKVDGYTIVGVEQTSGSVRLPDFAFDPQTVLVLGNEMKGIPAEILRLVDVCVEIPQLGTLRSLNAHVSGAISVYEFTRQLAMVK